MNRKEEVNKAIEELSTATNLLSVTADEITKNMILQYMRCKIYDLYLINNLENKCISTLEPIGNHLIQNQAKRRITKEELAGYNGKNGMPAYVAVNNTVYDVSNNAAWGAATHFGLAAGQDLTAQFASCHSGQPILQKLPIVGKMIE